MTIQAAQLPRLYADGTVLFQSQLDAWRLAALQAFNLRDLYLTQLAKDCFFPNYNFTGTGNQSLAVSLQQQILNLQSGAAPITGTISPTWTINSSASFAQMATVNLTAARIYQFPDAAGVFVIDTATQTISNKTINTSLLNAPSLNGPTLNTTELNLDDGSGGNYWLYGGGNTSSFFCAGASKITISTGSFSTTVDTNIGGQITVPTNHKIALNTTPNSYLIESAAGQVDLYSAGVLTLRTDGSGNAQFKSQLSIPTTNKFFLDGPGGGNYLINSAAGQNDLYSAGTLTLRTNSGGGITVANGLTVTAGGITVTAGDLNIASTAKLFLDGGSHNYFTSDTSQSVKLFLKSSANTEFEAIHFHTTGASASNGLIEITNSWQMETGNIVPNADNTYTLGSIGVRWTSVYCAGVGVFNGGIETGSNIWTLGNYTAGAPAATGYVTVVIGGVTRQLLSA